MPCSICGSVGHNRRTCPNNQVIQENNQIEVAPIDNEVNRGDILENQDIDDTLETIFLMERCLREYIIMDKVKEIDTEQLKLYENFLKITKKEFKIINLIKREISIYIVEGNSNFIDMNQSYNVRFLGKIPPRSILPITTFTGYRYIIADTLKMEGSAIYYISDISRNLSENKHVCNLDIQNCNEENINININDNGVISFKELNRENKLIHSLLKTDYLIKQIIRLGGMDNPNFEPILDLHQDIEIPEIELIDLEAAGVPNEFTNMN